MNPIRPPVSVLALDFDGLLVDSLAAKTEAWNDVFAHYPERSRESLEELRRANPGENRVEFVRRCVREHFTDEDEAGTHYDLMMRLVSGAMIDRVASCEEIAGSARVLAFGERLPLYIVSLTPLADLESIVERRGLAGHLRGLFGNPPWTKERALTEIAARERVVPSEILFVGDAAGDAEAAKTIGAQFVGVGDDETLRKTGAAVAPDLETFCGWLEDVLGARATPS